MKDLVPLFYFVIVVSGLPSYPIHPGVGAIYKGADSQTVIEGPDGSIIKAQAEGASVATGLKSHAILRNQAFYVTEPAPVVELNREALAAGLLEESANIEGPSGAISTGGSRSIIAGPTSTTITGPERVVSVHAGAPITQVRKSAVSISRTETIVATSVAPPIVVEDIAVPSPNLVAPLQGPAAANLRAATSSLGLHQAQNRAFSGFENQLAIESQLRQGTAPRGNIRVQQAAAELQAQQHAAAQFEAQQRAAAEIEAQQRAAAQIEAHQRAAAQIEAQQRAAAEIEAQQRAAAEIEAQQRAAAEAETQRRVAVQNQAIAGIQAEEQAAAELRAQQRVAATVQVREQAAAEIRAQEQAAAAARTQERVAAEDQAQQQAAAQIVAQEQEAAERRTHQRVDAEIKAQEQITASIRAQQEEAAIRAQQQTSATNIGVPDLRDSRLNGAGISRGGANTPNGNLLAPSAPPTSLAASGLSSARLAADAGQVGSPAFLAGGEPATNLLIQGLVTTPELVSANIATPRLVTAEIATPQLVTAEIPNLLAYSSPQFIATHGLSTATAEVTNGLVGAKSVAIGIPTARLLKRDSI